MPVKTGVSGRQQGAAEQKLQCERRASRTPGWHGGQRAAPDLYKQPGQTLATAANNAPWEVGEMKKNITQKDPSLNTLSEF